MHTDDTAGAQAQASGTETEWENSRRFAGRMMIAGIACFLLMLVLFLVGFLIEQETAGGWIDLGKVIGVVALLLFKLGFWMRRFAPHDASYEQAIERFVNQAATLQVHLRGAIARRDPAYPNAERVLRNVERWIEAAESGRLPQGPRNGLGLDKSGLDFGAAGASLQALEAAYNAIPRS